MPGPHESVSTQHTNQQVLAKPRHQPSERDQQARDRLRQKAKIKSRAYIQLEEKVLQTVHQTFEPNIPVILHLLAFTNTTTDTDTVPTLYVIQEGINYIPTTDYFFTSIKPEPIVVSRHRGKHFKPTAQCKVPFLIMQGPFSCNCAKVLISSQVVHKYIYIYCTTLGNVVRVYPRIVQGLTFLSA